MPLDAEKLVESALREGLKQAVKEVCTRSYNNPLDKMLEMAVAEQIPHIRTLLNEAASSISTDQSFRAELLQALRAQLAKTLVQRFGGELEKRVNELKSDPATRARITLALDEICKAKA